MSIRIHAAGTDNFRYSGSALPFGTVYALASVLSVVSAGAPHRVAGAAVESQVSPGSPVTQATAAIANMNARRVFQIGIHAIMAETPAPILFVAARESHLMWPDTGANMPETRLNTLTAHDLTRDIDAVLQAADMNTTGALFAIGTAFTRFAARHPQRVRPGRLMITLSH